MASEVARQLSREIRQQSTADKLRLAAELLDAGRTDLANTIVELARNEMTVAALKRLGST